MPLYELGLVINASLSEDERTAFVGEIRDLIANEGGEIVKEDVWGKRNLAYEIDHQREGYYIFWQIEAPGTLNTPLEYKLRIADNVLRYLMLNLDREMKRARKMDRIKAEKKAAKPKPPAAEGETEAVNEEA